MITFERILKMVLRVYGTVAGLAVFAIFMPRACMAATHEWIGLGAFPDGVIVEYLARSASALYAFHGGLLWLLSRDVKRYASIITYVAAAGMIFGAFMFALDIRLGLPLHWVVSEGPPVVAISTVVLVLLSKVGKEAARTPPL